MSLHFEEKIIDLETKVSELRYLCESDGIDLAEQVMALEEAINKELRRVYHTLTPWQKVQVSRHPNRPRFESYLQRLLTQRFRLRGDRLFGEDPAITVEIGRFQGMVSMWAGHEKGSNNTTDRIAHNFGMARPEGYRKFIRSLKVAEKFALPVITLINTPGAFPGKDAEDRGQAEAIAQSINACLDVETPLLAVIVGEGGSGGAVALAAADMVLMMEHATYSVISPEGCSAILWRDASESERASEALKLTAPDLQEMGVVDHIIKEPLGAAHRNPNEAIDSVGEAINKTINTLISIPHEQRRKKRQERFLALGSDFLPQ